MKYILIVSLLLSGCGYIYPETIQIAEEKCEPNGGIHRFELLGLAWDVVCKNGAEFDSVWVNKKAHKK